MLLAIAADWASPDGAPHLGHIAWVARIGLALGRFAVTFVGGGGVNHARRVENASCGATAAKLQLPPAHGHNLRSRALKEATWLIIGVLAHSKRPQCQL